MKALIKRVLSKGLFKPALRGKVYIFCLHDISPEAAPHHYNGYSTTPERFAKQVEFICKHFEVIPVSQLANPGQLSQKKAYACITFDDGFLSVLQVAAPLLHSMQVPFSVFINERALLENALWCSDLVLMDDTAREAFYYANADQSLLSLEQYRQNPVFTSITGLQLNAPDATTVTNRPRVYLTIDEIRRLQQQYGAEIGYHSNSHKNLARCTGAALDAELNPATAAVQELLAAQPVQMFAIPFGKKTHYTPEVIKKLRQQYALILTTSADYNKVRTIQPPMVSRIGITNETTPELCSIINTGLIKKYNL